jgi:hypothetical protein
MHRAMSLQGNHMTASKSTVLLPVLLIAVGSGWLLSRSGIAPEVDWVWTLILAALGIFTFILGGLDKVTAIVGPLLLVGSGMSWLRQTGRISVGFEVPALMILGGVLALVAHLRIIPPPRWLRADNVE